MLFLIYVYASPSSKMACNAIMREPMGRRGDSKASRESGGWDSPVSGGECASVQSMQRCKLLG